MYKIRLLHVEKTEPFAELLRVFLPPDQYALLSDDAPETPDEIRINEASAADRNTALRELYTVLSRLTGKRPVWGILTGIRPVKLCGELYRRMNGDGAAVLRRLETEYLLDPEKARLLLELHLRQQDAVGPPPPRSAGIYIGIPFCPTRCLYCSFTSNQVAGAEIERYLTALHREIRYVGARMAETGLQAETVYIGGGTPTTLDAPQLAALLEEIRGSMDLSALREFTVEAGRPDTIDAEKLQVLRTFGVDRISINPQTMQSETLRRIGRAHTPEEVLRAFALARDAGFRHINCDVIAGLPGEETGAFMDTLTRLMALDPESITVHCLAVKRASRLIAEDPAFHYRQGALVDAMLSAGQQALRQRGWTPYYLYRQKQMAGALENVGYAKPGRDGIYNVRIMDEHQTILALGAGGISKVYDPAADRLERVANVSNYTVYIDRIEEMLERKEKSVFREVKTIWQS